MVHECDGLAARPEFGVLVDRQVLTGLGAVRHARDVHGVTAGDGLGEEPWIARRVLATKLARLRIEPETFDHVQLFAVRDVSIQHARRKADGVDDEHVVFPAANRMAGDARRDVLRVLGQIQVDRAHDTEPAVLNRDRVAALRDPVHRLAAPFGDDAREDAGQRVAVRGWTRGQRGPAGRGQVGRRTTAAARRAATTVRIRARRRLPPGRCASAGGRDLRRGLLGVAGTRYRTAGREVAGRADLLDLAERHQRPDLPARIRHDDLLLSPVARDVRLTVGQFLRPLALAEPGWCRDLSVPIELRAIVEEDRTDVAGIGVIAVGRTSYCDLSPDLEE